MENAKAVEPQWRANVFSISAKASTSAPPPPRSVGTPACSKAEPRNRAKFSATNWSSSAEAVPERTRSGPSSRAISAIDWLGAVVGHMFSSLLSTADRFLEPRGIHAADICRGRRTRDREIAHVDWAEQQP